MEQWHEIPGFEGWYQVSDTGLVRSVQRLVIHSDGRKRVYPSVVLRQYTDDFGYAKVTLKRNGVDWRVHIHHLVALTFHGPRPEGLWVCHRDGVRTNNTPDNLRYDTPASNAADAVRHGTAARTRKFSEEDVAAVRALRGKMRLADVAQLFKISKTHVCNIQRGNRRTL